MNHYFYLLGLSPHASLAEVKAAYRKLAFQYHPDHNPDNPEAERRFKEISHAYQVLLDFLKSPRPGTTSKQQAEDARRQEEIRKARKKALEESNKLYRGKAVPGHSCPRCHANQVRSIFYYQDLHGIPYTPYLLNVARCDNCGYVFNLRTGRRISDTLMQVLSMLLGLLIFGLLFWILIQNMHYIL